MRRFTPHWSLVVTGLAAATVAAAVPMAPAAAAPTTGLADQVRATVLAERGPTVARQRGLARIAPEAIVEPRRSEGSWSFGVATIPGAADGHGAPDPSLYVARRTAGRWQVAILGSPEFVALARQAPASVVSADEKTLFAANHAAAAPTTGLAAAALPADTGLALPFRKGTSAGMGGGPHANDGSGSLYSSIDFGGTGTEIHSAGPGRVYRACVDAGSTAKALILIVHPNGYVTGYYHLNQRTDFPADGTQIGVEYYLGTAGTNTACGGSANGAHVHFTLRSGNNTNPSFESVVGRTIGGWTFHSGGSNYTGPATHADRKAVAGTANDSLTNYGVYAGNGPYAGTVNTSGGANVRYNTSTSTSSVMYLAPNGRALSLSCRTTGSTVNNSNVWYRLTDADYVAAALVSTTATVPAC
ncbi:M23 family metallopeptidase [Longispora urticae]